MTRYAENTSVSAERSRAEIETILERYGADQFMYGRDDKQQKAIIQFRMNNRYIKFIVPLPDKNDPQFKKTPAGRRRRSDDSAYRAYEQATRQRWRALGLVIKAKLEAVESEKTEFEQEFMAHIVLPDGSTVGEYMIPQIEQAYLNRKMPKMLPLLDNRK
jgi:hypothetical protein